MTISATGVSTWADRTTTSITATAPNDIQPDDMMIMRTATKPYTATTSWIPSTSSPIGVWAPVGNTFANGSTASGNGTGSLSFRAWWKIAMVPQEGLKGIMAWSATPSPGTCALVVYRKAPTEEWEVPVGAGGGDATARTSHTATIGSHISVTAGDMVDFYTAWCDNYAATVPNITQTGVTYASVVEYPATAHISASSNDMAADGGYRYANSGTSSAAAVVTGTFGNSEQAGSWQTRLRVYTPKLTNVARVSLSPISSPTYSGCYFAIRARTQSGAGVLKVALYEGSTNITGDLSTIPLTTSLADYTVGVSNLSLENISSYSNLELRFWGKSASAAAVTFEVDSIVLVTAAGVVVPVTPYRKYLYPQLLAH